MTELTLEKVTADIKMLHKENDLDSARRERLQQFKSSGWENEVKALNVKISGRYVLLNGLALQRERMLSE